MDAVICSFFYLLNRKQKNDDVMKKLTYYLSAILLMVGGLFQSCDDGDYYSLGDIAVDWATVEVKGAHTYSLVGDQWGSLWPAATSIPWYTPVDGQRVLAVFNPLGDNFQGYDHAIKMEGVREILTKKIEQLTKDNEADFGHDPVAIKKDNMWISGGYLNVVFEQNLPLEVKHRISLVYTDTLEPDVDGYVTLELRYNTYQDTSDYWVNGAVSYNLNAIKGIQDLKGIKIKVNSKTDGDIVIPFEFVSTSIPTEVQKMNFSKMELH